MDCHFDWCFWTVVLIVVLSGVLRLSFWDCRFEFYDVFFCDLRGSLDGIIDTVTSFVCFVSTL